MTRLSLQNSQKQWHNRMYTLLVVEDNPDNMLLIADILEDEGYHVLKAIDAEQGIHLLDHERVHLILMDVSLPLMSGLEATHLLKTTKKYKNIPIIILTAFAMDSDREAALSAGCDAYLTKPIDEDRLLTTIQKFL